MSASDIDVLVIGAGAAGLAAAHTLQQAGLQPQVVDARSEAGGVIGTTRVAGHAVERGPNSLRVTPAARRFLERCGADTLLEKATPASRRRWLLHSGSLVEVPSRRHRGEPSQNYGKLENHFIAEGVMKKVVFGDADCHLGRAKGMADLTRKYLTRDPLLFSHGKPPAL